MRGLPVAFRVAGTVVMLAVVVPAFVVLATMVGLEPTHWSGVRQHRFDLPLLTQSGGDSPPEPARILLSDARTLDEVDAGDLAPSYWDSDAGQVVLGAVTDRGVAMRRALGDAAGVGYRVDRRPRSASELATIMHGVLPWDEHGAVMSFMDPEGNRVVLGVRCLSHGLFADVDARYGDAVTVAADPFAPIYSTGGPPADMPSWWDRARPATTWFTLVTGFPWYLATGLAAIAAIWIPPIRRRRAAIVS